MKSLVSSSDDASDQESNMDKYTIYSKDNKVYELKNSGYMKKKIISAIKKSLKTNNNKHSLTLNDVSVSEEKEIGNGCRQSLNIRIALDDKLYFTGDAADGPINIETFKLNDSTPAAKCCSHCSGKEPKTEDDWPSYFSCVKCARKEKRKWYHENCKDKCCTATSIYCDNCLRFKLTSIDHNFDVLDNKFAKYMYVVTCPNGGGISLHMDYEKIMHFTQDEQNVIAKEFLKEAFKEDKKGFAQFTIAIVHNGASYMPDLLKLLAELHPTLPVKTTKLKCNTETEVMDLGTYYTKVKETYSNGTFAFNPLNEIQAASVKNDECGAYLPELLSLLEKSAFLTQVLPWSDMTTKRFKSPHESDDGPIFWCRPGEQIVSLDRNSKRNRWNADEIESFLKERQQNLKFFCEKRYIVEELKKYRRSYSSREVLFEDRTRPHADQVWGNHFECTAAVGVIQAIHPDEIPEQNRACKEIVVFHAKHFEMLEALLHIDVTAAPKQQCAEWLDDAKLNMIRQMNIRYSKLHLYDNDIYFIPRKIVHQFKTISATLSVAWHTRLIEYYLETNPSPASEPAEGSEPAATSAGIKGEALSDNEDASSSCSSNSLPPPAKTRKTPTATPKKKRKLSCSRSTVSTDTEATPRKRKKPRSRSSTPQKRVTAEKTPKKKLQKTPKKVLVLEEEEEEEDEDKKPAITAPPPQEQKRSPSPEIPPQPAEPPSQPKESTSSSRSGSPVVPATPTKKKSPLSAKKRESDDVDTGEHSKKKKHRSRSRSRSRKHSDTSSADKDRTKTDSSESKSASKKKKKDKSRSKSPKKSDKTKDANAVKSDGSDTPSKSNKKSSHSSSSKKHNDDHSKSSAVPGESDKHRKKHRSDKDKKSRTDSHRSDSSHKKESEKTPPSVSAEPPNQISTTVTAESPDPISTTVTAEPPNSISTTATSVENNDNPSDDIESRPKSPLPSMGSLNTEKHPSPLSAPSVDNVTPSRSTSPTADISEPEDTFTVVDECASPTPDSPQREEGAPPLSSAPPPEPEPEESAVLDKVSEESKQLEIPSTQMHIKDEPKSPSAPENGPVRINHETAVKPEPREEVVSSAPTTVKEEPETKTMAKQKETNASIPALITKSVPEKPLRKPAASSGADAPRSNKDHRNKEKLWDTPLFMPQDCDKYEWTKRSSSTTVASNRISTKNGDKIVKQKTLNSLQNHNKAEDKNTANNTSASAKPRSRSKSPPTWIKKQERERKAEESNKPTPSSELKKSTTNSSSDKRSSSEKDKSSSSDKHRDKEKKSSEHKRSKETSSAGKKDRDRSEQQPEKKKSSHTKESSDKSSSSAGSSNQSEKSHSGSKDHSHEKRKRSRTPPSSVKQHRDKHSSSASKKHKKHRSKSRDRREPSAEKTKPSTSSSTTQDAESKEPAAVVNSSPVTVSLKNAQDAELAANYKLMIPRVQIVDIGAKYKTGDVQDTSISANNYDSAEDAESATTTNANDQNATSETSDETAPTVDNETENQTNE